MLVKRIASYLTLALLASATAEARQSPVTVAERFFTPIDTQSNVDSIAVWHGPDSEERLLIATSKAAHKLYVYDAKNGFPISQFGTPGSELGQFLRPNGIASADDFLFVVERDNHRVQILRLPDFTPLTSFGSEELIKPYGIYLRKIAEGSFQAYVSDDYNKVLPGEKPEPNPAGIRKRVKRFQIVINGQGVDTKLINAFGEHEGPHALDVVESLMGDEASGKLMVADEDEQHGLEIHVFDLEGNDTGKRLGQGTFQFQPEGIALWETIAGKGYWIFTDQGKQANHYHVYDRKNLSYRGTFSGERTLNTDGVAIDLKPTARYPMGVFYGIHDDCGVSAWSIADISKELQLR
ncbi:phytase [Pelagicoccus mobilis]|uniref:Phytase n=1 Tax=Pelagicoccus mobilis TaxID=415221 RepID=A0A934RZL2_9BACT|nr:phytase [Pelagicoccus mobilis]MBK1876393.1 phytase [Pelagicoccus mobilis]